jgi:hypothetical protein
VRARYRLQAALPLDTLLEFAEVWKLRSERLVGRAAGWGGVL